MVMLTMLMPVLIMLLMMPLQDGDAGNAHAQLMPTNAAADNAAATDQNVGLVGLVGPMGRGAE